MKKLLYKIYYVKYMGAWQAVASTDKALKFTETGFGENGRPYAGGPKMGRTRSCVKGAQYLIRSVSVPTG